jgi:hypothetical protein
MAFQLSPGVVVQEKDFSTIVPQVATSAGAFAGVFSWGPIADPVQITSEIELAQRFGTPNDDNFTSFFSAANFLAYANNLLVVRADSALTTNAVSSGTAIKITNADAYQATYQNGSADVGEFAAKWAGAAGNSLLVSMADSATFTGWAYEDEFDSAPGTSAYATQRGGSADEMHIIIIDEDGAFTGSAGTIIEKFAFTSKGSDAKAPDGSTSYYKNVLNARSRYVWWMDHPTEGTNFGDAVSGTTFVDLDAPVTNSLIGGVDDYASTPGEIQAGYVPFANDELYDISLVVMGKAPAVTAKFVIDNVVEVRKDCMVFVSPESPTGEPITSASATAIADMKTYRTALGSTSYGVMDSGVKYQYDRYNDKYRFIPLNGDIAGLCARTDYAQDPWYSPAGTSRGQIKNVVKLGISPNKTQRDELYKNGINPVVTFPGSGTQLFGDKTLLTAPSAFDRINVRRLFIVLEKAISISAKAQLFEFNDSFTRAAFKNAVEPFLRDVQGRRGVTDFRVVCDETNNTGEVIDRNEFAADIFIKPNRSINFINLTFVAARTSVSFDEIGG